MFGHSRHFKRFLEAKWRDLYRVAYVWTHDSDLAADLVQETITRCLKNRQKFENEKDLKIWLFKVMTNCWRDNFRQKKNIIALDEVDLYSTTNLESEHYQQQIIRDLKKAFELLNQHHREVLTLVIVEGMSYESIAEVLDIPIGTVMSRVSRARLHLKDLIANVQGKEKKASTVRRIK